MLMGCNCGVKSLRGMRGLAATNDQIPATQYAGPVGGFSCNTAGGYKLVTPAGYMTAQCMTDAQLAAANASYAVNIASQPIVQSDPTVKPPTPGVSNTNAPSSGSGAVVLTTPFDPVAFAKENWMYIAGGALALILIAKG